MERNSCAVVTKEYCVVTVSQCRQRKRNIAPLFQDQICLIQRKCVLVNDMVKRKAAHPGMRSFSFHHHPTNTVPAKMHSQATLACAGHSAGHGLKILQEYFADGVNQGDGCKTQLLPVGEHNVGLLKQMGAVEAQR